MTSLYDLGRKTNNIDDFDDYYFLKKSFECENDKHEDKLKIKIVCNQYYSECHPQDCSELKTLRKNYNKIKHINLAFQIVHFEFYKVENFGENFIQFSLYYNLHSITKKIIITNIGHTCVIICNNYLSNNILQYSITNFFDKTKLMTTLPNSVKSINLCCARGYVLPYNLKFLVLDVVNNTCNYPKNLKILIINDKFHATNSQNCKKYKLNKINILELNIKHDNLRFLLNLKYDTLFLNTHYYYKQHINGDTTPFIFYKNVKNIIINSFYDKDYKHKIDGCPYYDGISNILFNFPNNINYLSFNVANHIDNKYLNISKIPENINCFEIKGYCGYNININNTKIKIFYCDNLLSSQSANEIFNKSLIKISFDKNKNALTLVDKNKNNKNSKKIKYMQYHNNSKNDKNLNTIIQKIASVFE
jgi:hypothetical protein